jgi:hypothetical protein
MEESGGADSAVPERYSQAVTTVIEQPSAGQQVAMDVYGHQIEPICKCRHPLNYALFSRQQKL